MDRRDLDEIERFLNSVGRASLFVYYGVDPDADVAALDDAVKKRRTWAQGQQSNPKYKSEALFVIKNNALLRRVLIDDLDAYRAHVRDDSHHRNLDVLTLFIRGTLTSGILAAQAEAAIFHQGRQLQLSDAAVARRLEELLAETGARRAEPAAADDVTAEATSIDHYAILGVAVNAPGPAIEEAYRNRYRWARSLKDLKRSAEVLQALDEAWRILSDPNRRARYDVRRLEMLEVTDEVEKRAAALMGLLGGPEDAITGEAPLPGAPPAPVHEVGFRSATAPPGTRTPTIDARVASAELRPEVAPPPIRVDPPPAADVGRAPVPPTLQGRTIGLAAGPQTVATLGPRLAIDGPDVLTFTVTGRRVQRTLKVRNAGHGKMPGRVVSDREWLQVPQPRLDPTRPEQQIALVVLPDQMPWGRTAGTVTVVTDHGERRTITLQVHRRSWMPVIAGVFAAGFLGAAAIAAAVLLWTQAPATALALTVDPVADRVFVNGTLVGRGATFDLPEPTPGRPFLVRVEADGFDPKEETVTLRPGERTQRTILLDLADDMSWTPPASAAGVPAPPKVRETVEGMGARLGGCFPPDATPAPEATYTAWVTGDGQVRRLDVADANFSVETVQPCLRRVFRGLRLDPFPGDHAAVEAHLAAGPR